MMGPVKEVIRKFKSKTPKKWRRIRNALITIGGVSGVILTAPVALPAALLTLAGYGAFLGTVGAVLAQTKEEKKFEQNPEQNEPI
jgi:peptidoglycan hydrolase-like protein with peptidoglycan-binding domain